MLKCDGLVCALTANLVQGRWNSCWVQFEVAVTGCCYDVLAMALVARKMRLVNLAEVVPVIGRVPWVLVSLWECLDMKLKAIR